MNGKKATPYAIGVDIGGTSVRCGLVSDAGRLRQGSYHRAPVDSKGPARAITDAFIGVMGENVRQARRDRLPLVGIGVGMCGPLDYDEGIVLMRGVDKYESLYGTNLKSVFRQRLSLAAEFPICMEPDSWAFARGEAWMGAGKGFRRILALTLGTGFGSAFVADGELLDQGPRVPFPYGWIGSLPFRGRLLDDFISRRGILALYRSLASTPLSPRLDVRHIALRARSGNRVCRQVFEEFGRLLGAALAPIIREFGAECLIFGGRISKAFDLFEKPMRRELQNVPSLQRVTVAHSIGRATLWGAARFVFASVNRG
jgi:glucokinase